MVVRFSLVSFGLAISFGCATTAPPPRVNPHAAAIGVTVKIEVSLAPDEHASRVYFARVDEHGALGAIIESNYVNGKYAYLLNVKPGRYVVVAAGYTLQGTDSGLDDHIYRDGEWVEVPGAPGTGSAFNIVYVPQELADDSAVRVFDDGFAFAGEIVLDNSGNWETADEIQQRTYEVLAPGHRDRNSLVKIVGDQHWVSGRHDLDRGVSAKQRFLDHSGSALAGSGWESLLLHPVGAGSPQE